MKTVQLQQGSPEWLAFRRERIGASDTPAIMGKSPFKTAFDLWEEKSLGREGRKSAAMTRGSLMEQEARDWYNRTYGTNFQPAVGIHEENDWMMASLDGYDPEKNFHLEIKCPGEATIESIASGNIPEYILWQVQHQLYVNGLEKAVLLTYNQSRQIETCLFRDQSMIDDLVASSKVFYFDYLVAMIPPLLKDADSEERTDFLWECLAEERQGINLQLEELKIQDEKNRQAMIEAAAGRPCRGFGVSLTKCIKAGSIDYKKIPQLKSLDLEAYRKPPVEYWRVSCS